MEIGIRVSTSGCAVIKAAGEVDRASGQVLFAALEENRDSDEIALDLSGAGVLNSSFVNALVMFRNQYPRQSKRLRIVAPTPDALEILRLTNLDRIFPISES